MPARPSLGVSAERSGGCDCPRSLAQPDLQAPPDAVRNFSGERSTEFGGLQTAMGMGSLPLKCQVKAREASAHRGSPPGSPLWGGPWPRAGRPRQGAGARRAVPSQPDGRAACRRPLTEEAANGDGFGAAAGAATAGD